MTNTMLVNIDKLSSDVIFVAATNRYESLDSAFTRRFDVKFKVEQPTFQEKQKYAKQLLEYYKLDTVNEIDTELFQLPITLSKLDSYSEIKDEVLKVARTFIINKIKNNGNN